MAEEQRGIFHKQTFDHTSEDRRNRLLETAVEEFSEKGFQGTNVNVIAQKAGISVGALYRYFASKEDLYLSVVSRQRRLLEMILSEIDEEADIYSQIKTMFRMAKVYGKKYAQYSRINLELATQPMKQLAERLSDQMESPMADYLIELIRRNKEAGHIDPAVDERVSAFCIDNLLIMYQLASSSHYFEKRLALYIGKTDDSDDTIDKMMQVIRRQFAASS